MNDYLTTNYTYELESVAIGSVANDNQLSKAVVSTLGTRKKDCKYQLHVYNNYSYEGKTKRIWHIHGEQRKLYSIILGYKNYFGLLTKIAEYYKKEYSKSKTINCNKEINSWIDCFMTKTVHVLGFSFDFSEIDLWWLLLNRKAKENSSLIYYYVAHENEFTDALKKAGVNITYVTHTVRDGKVDYMNYYNEAINLIEKNMTLL